ncbi:MAG: 4'-phosphopantetheinyl transferase [Flavobacteriales bacterium]|nr:MAG: 4'-phosphopantetheinyl transferase [Flavobacteriales bacterium]
MPLYKTIKHQDTQVYLWKYDETDILDAEKLIEKENIEKVQKYRNKKLTEFIMIRALKNIDFPEDKILYKATGEPYFGSTQKHLSITHSFPFAGLAIAKNKVGIDLEKVQPKIQKLSPKFINANEEKWLKKEVDYLTIIWCIKEALYKLHPSKHWSLKKHYEVFPFELNTLDKISCRVFDENTEDFYTAKVMKMEDYYLAIVQ